MNQYKWNHVTIIDITAFYRKTWQYEKHFLLFEHYTLITDSIILCLLHCTIQGFTHVTAEAIFLPMN